jgi:lactoylglutathione lyase
MMLGIVPAETNIKMEKENVIEDILRVGVGETAVEIDLMTPIDPEKSPKVRRRDQESQ